MITTILLAVVFSTLVYLVALWLNRQTVEVERVEPWHVRAEPLYDWVVRCPEWRRSSIITPEEWDAMCWRLKQSSGVA